MRILHTSDLHVGRTLGNFSLLDDQRAALGQIADIARHENVDVVVLAGDLYDRAVPSAEAVHVVDDFLVRLVVHEKRKVLAIAGNHDSPERIGFTNRVQREVGLHLRGTLADLSPVILHDEHGPVAFHLLPYAEVAMARQHANGGGEVEEAEALPDGEGDADDVAAASSIRTHQAAMAHLVQASLTAGPVIPRRVVVAHAFVSGGTVSDSERDLSVGGVSQVAASTFDDFNYVALGHLHRAQQLGETGRVRYSGSPLKYSLSEADHVKSVAIVDLDDAGQVSVRTIPIVAPRDVRVISGLIDDLLRTGDGDTHAHDFVGVRLTDEIPPHDPVARLSRCYPFLINVEPARRVGDASDPASETPDPNRTPLDLFSNFYSDMTGTDLDGDEREVVVAAITAAMSRHVEAH